MDITGIDLHRYAAVFGFHGFFNIYVSVGNVNLHVIFSNDAAFPIAAYCYITSGDRCGHIFTCFNVRAYLYIASGDCCIYVVARGDVVVDCDVAGINLQHNIVIRLHIGAYHYITAGDRCLHVVACSNVVIDTDIAGFNRQFSGTA